MLIGQTRVTWAPGYQMDWEWEEDVSPKGNAMLVSGGGDVDIGRQKSATHMAMGRHHPPSAFPGGLGARQFPYDTGRTKAVAKRYRHFT